MVQRKLLVLVMAGFVLVTSACGPFFSRPIRNPILIDIRTSTPTPTATGPNTSPTPSPSLTPTSTGAYFTLTRNSNCYNGPGPAYNVVLIISSGETVEVIGRNRDTTWWRIYTNTSMDCWVASESGRFTGVASLIPITSSQYATKALTPLSPTQERQIFGATTNTALFIPASATATVRPPATNTPLPSATNTLRPPATITPRPSPTRTPLPLPSATNPPPPTATNPPPPTATDPPPPATATNPPPPPDDTATPEPPIVTP